MGGLGSGGDNFVNHYNAPTNFGGSIDVRRDVPEFKVDRKK